MAVTLIPALTWLKKPQAFADSCPLPALLSRSPSTELILPRLSDKPRLPDPLRLTTVKQRAAQILHPCRWNAPVARATGERTHVRGARLCRRFAPSDR